MAEQKKSILVIIVLTFSIITLHLSGYLPYEMLVMKHLEEPDLLPESREGQESDLAAGEHNIGTTSHGFVQPFVVDGFTEDPIAGAQVVVPELNMYFPTGKDGMTAPIKVPVRADSNFERINPKTWGEITLIVYKENYIEYVLLNAQVSENEVRKGPMILLFPISVGGRNQPFALIESPHDEWVSDLVDKYRKDE